MIQTPQQALRERLPKAIHESGLSLGIIAQLSGYSASYIRRVKNGHLRNPTITFVWAVGSTVGVNPAWLLGWEQ